MWYWLLLLLCHVRETFCIIRLVDQKVNFEGGGSEKKDWAKRRKKSGVVDSAKLNRAGYRGRAWVWLRSVFFYGSGSAYVRGGYAKAGGASQGADLPGDGVVVDTGEGLLTRRGVALR